MGDRLWLGGMLPLAQAVECFAQNREQPAFAAPTAEAAEEPEGAQIRFLHHVLGEVIVAGQPAREVVGHIEMRQRDLRKALRLLVLRHAPSVNLKVLPPQDRLYSQADLYFHAGN